MQEHLTQNTLSAAEDAGSGNQWSPERISNVTRNVLIVLGSGIILGVFTATNNLYYVAAAIAAALLVILVAWQFEAAICIYMLVAFVPWGKTPDLAVGGSGVGKGVFVSEAMLGFLLLVWFGKYLLRSLPKQRISSGFYVPLALYICYCVLNVVHSYLFWDPHLLKSDQRVAVNVIELGIRVLSAGGLALVATTVSSRKWLRLMTIALLVAGGYNILNALAGYPVPLIAPWWGLLSFLPAAYCCALALDNGQPVWKRILSAGALGVTFFQVFVVGVSWVSGWFGLLATIASVVFLKSRKVFVVTALVVCVVAALAWPYIDSNVVQSSQEEGDYDRFAMLNAAWRYATTFPLGVGLGNYRTYNEHYGAEWKTTTYSSAHGTYAQALSETGFLGLALFLSVFVCGFRWLLKKYREATDGGARLFLLAAMGQMCGIAASASIGDYIFPTYHNGGLVSFSTTVYSWIIWGLSISYARLTDEHYDGFVDNSS